MPMHSPNEPLKLELPVERVSVTKARHAAGEFAAACGAARDDVELAVSEAVSNSVVHGYPGDAGGTIRMRAEVRGPVLIIVVRDDGTGLRPDLENKGFGLGLPLIARVSEEYRIEDAPGGGAVVTMQFGLQKTAASEPSEFGIKTGTAAGGVALVKLAGDLDLPASPQFETALSTAEIDTSRGVVIDMTGLGFLDSSGIRALLLACERFRQGGRGLALALEEGSRVRRVLALTGVEARMPLYGSLEEALSFVSGETG